MPFSGSQNELQTNILRMMANAVRAHAAQEIGLHELVTSLEAALVAGDFKERSFLDRWYSLWEPLEILNAERLAGIPASADEVDHLLCLFEELLATALGADAASDGLDGS
jgi:hypothetical protein